MLNCQFAQEDSFEDAPDVSHRHNSLSPGRSLINRSRSSSAETATRDKVEVKEENVADKTEDSGLGIDGAGDKEIDGESSRPQSEAKRISVGDLDEVNLEGGMYTLHCTSARSKSYDQDLR